ncbi:hypothetical protein [Streptomyces sp. NPDC001205]
MQNTMSRPASEIPAVEITGTVYRLTVQTDRQGAVLVAYTRDDEGRVCRSWLRMDGAAADYIRRRLSGADALGLAAEAEVQA